MFGEKNLAKRVDTSRAWCRLVSMTTKTTYTATAPDGTVFTRKSARSYEYAVLVYGTSWNNAEPHWGLISFNSRADLAYKEASKWTGVAGEHKGRKWAFTRVKVVPATVAGS